MRHSCSSSDRSGFTLIELLVALAVLAILLGLLISVLASSRATAKSLVCSTRLKQLGDLVSAYTVESQDTFPAWLDGRDFRHQPERWSSYTYQTFSTLPNEKWLTWSGLETDSEALYCPDNQQFPQDFQQIASPDYVMSACIFGESNYFKADLAESQWRSRLGDKVQSIANARFPSDKVGLLELFVWHGWGKSYCEGCPVGDLEYTDSRSPGSLWFMDGHVEQRFATDALPYVYRYPIWPYMPFGTTVAGITGRDR